LVDLRRRGIDVAAGEVPSSRWIPDAVGPAAQLGTKLWDLQRSTLRARFDAMGVPVVAWAPGEPVESVVARLARIRRRAS
jgi:hypothetical protein